MDIQESTWSPQAVHFVVEDAQMPFFFDVYVVDRDAGHGRPDVQCVALFPSCASLPNYMYAPRASAEGLRHERLIEDAVRAYLKQHPRQLDAVRAP